MNFDIQRFASISINGEQTYVTATTTAKTYTIKTTSAAPQIENIEELAEELQELIASGEATGKVDVDGDIVDVKVATDGKVTPVDSSVDLNSLVGKTVLFNGDADPQTARLAPAVTISGTVDGTAASGTVTLRADSTYTTYFVVNFGDDGVVESVSYFDGDSTQTTATSVLADQTLLGDADPDKNGSVNATTDSAYSDKVTLSGIEGDSVSAGYSVAVNEGAATFYGKDGATLTSVDGVIADRVDDTIGYVVGFASGVATYSVGDGA